jgi:hypothetical protein
MSKLQSLEGQETGALSPEVSQQPEDTMGEVGIRHKCSVIPLSIVATWGGQPSDCFHKQADRKHESVCCGIPTLTFYTSLDDTA